MATLSLKKSSNRVIQKPVEPIPVADTAERYREYLVQSYPEVFNLAHPKPLAIRIRSVLIKARPDWASHAAVRLALYQWTSQRSYQQAIARGGSRYNLDGTQAEEILPEHRARAKKRLEG